MPLRCCSPPARSESPLQREYGRSLGFVTDFDRITRDVDVMGGKPCIRGTRVTVGVLVELVATGKTFDEILQAYPYLGPR